MYKNIYSFPSCPHPPSFFRIFHQHKKIQTCSCLLHLKCFIIFILFLVLSTSYSSREEAIHLFSWLPLSHFFSFLHHKLFRGVCQWLDVRRQYSLALIALALDPGSLPLNSTPFQLGDLGKVSIPLWASVSLKWQEKSHNFRENTHRLPANVRG